MNDLLIDGIGSAATSIKLEYCLPTVWTEIVQSNKPFWYLAFFYDQPNTCSRFTPLPFDVVMHKIHGDRKMTDDVWSWLFYFRRKLIYSPRVNYIAVPEIMVNQRFSDGKKIYRFNGKKHLGDMWQGY